MKKDLYGTRLYVNLNSLEKNIKVLKTIHKNTKIIAMVKANAYGHGDIVIAKKMENCGISYFGVADFEEGIRLRNNGVQQSIMVMNPGVNNLEAIIKHNIDPVIYNKTMLSALIQYVNNTNPTLNKVQIHIKINTGMNRWGFDISELPEILWELKNQQRIQVVSIYSHLASADISSDDFFTLNQIKKLLNASALFTKELNYKTPIHILNSSGVLRGFNTSQKFHYSRVGIMLYGGGDHPKLDPISELRCTISQIREVDNGASIGYQRKFISDRKLRIGIIPFGYADGLQRQWGNGVLKFYFQNQFIPTVGNISMDSCIVDLSAIDNISVGDDVVYFGEKRPIWDLANELGTIPYEITSTLSMRIKRIYT